ncbi:MAG: phosphotransferase [Candidatus Binatia bacterium]
MESASLATLTTHSRLADALTSTALRALDGPRLLRFLGAQRWFGAKGRAGLRARFRDSVPIFGSDMRALIARVQVTAADESTLDFQLPLTVGSDLESWGIHAERLANVAGATEQGFIADAAGDPAFRGRLLQAVRDAETFTDGNLRWVVERYAGDLPPPGTDSRLLGGEQSNTSIAYADCAIVKLYRRLTPGPNPEAEIAQFLRAQDFPHVPALLGDIRLEDRNGEQTTLGVVQEFVASLGDGWSYVRGLLRDVLRSPHSSSAIPAALLDDCWRLGEITGQLHGALAHAGGDEAFVPQPVRAEDLAEWGGALRRQVDGAAELLQAELTAGRLDTASAAAARVVVDRARSLGDRAREFLEAISGDAGARIRHHGDYHLGQVLRKANGDFVILDFEGEPARPLPERQRRHSPLRDVAGMLRSLSYAAAFTAKDDLRGEADARVEATTAKLGAPLRTAFLEGYFSAAPAAPILPADSSIRDGLLTVFEVEKAFYELVYEINNRPTWVSVPLSAIRALTS